MKPQKLKLGLLLDSLEVPAWFFHSLERIVKSDIAEFVILVLIDRGDQDTRSNGFNKQRLSLNGFVYEVFNKVDEKIFVRKAFALRTSNIRDMLSNVQVVKVKPIIDGEAAIIKPEDARYVRDLELDILIKFGFQQLRGDILTAAKYGVWFYDLCDSGSKWGELQGFWEVVKGLPETGSSLVMANQDWPGGRIIYRSRTMTYPFSPARNTNISCWASSSFLSRQINLLYQLGEKRFFEETEKYNCEFDSYDHRQDHAPASLPSLKFYSKWLARNMHELYQRLFFLYSWYLMFNLSTTTSLSFEDFKKISPAKDRYCADPHIIRKDNKFYIFVEEYLYKNSKGHISVIEMDLQGQCKDPVPVLETDYHLSYPFVFEYNNQYYMVPESAHNRTIDLYECVEFPVRWKFKKRLMDNVRAVDTTLFYHLEKWWLFTGITENMSAYPEVELFLFYSDDLFTSEWKSHPLNPVVSDVTCARPAGKIFVKDGKIYRPSQNCSRNYGYGFNISEISCLSETDYFEKKVVEVKPNWDKGLIAAHTYACADGIVMIDALIRRSKYNQSVIRFTPST